ncbi:MAG: 2-amino-4-hydroxy-6-hydroxymethyldihydropteridine diphosphokinase [Thainema sp.]
MTQGTTNGVRCAIAMGSNLGDSVAILSGALTTLNQQAEIELVEQSSLYRTAPVGPPQPDYLNACAVIRTTLPAPDLMQRLLAIEAQFGRVRRERWGARHLDLDLLLYGDQIIQTETLYVPHPRFRERAFVLVPLSDVAADWLDPVTGHAIADLVKAVDCSGVYRL